MGKRTARVLPVDPPAESRNELTSTKSVRGEDVEVPANQRTAVTLDPLDPHGHKHPETNVCPQQCFRDGDQRNTI